jgi:hypothetical protein
MESHVKEHDGRLAIASESNTWMSIFPFGIQSVSRYLAWTWPFLEDLVDIAVKAPC